ncbi:hypothetical protein VPH35_015239 [Triticum aestivum]
MAAAGHGQTAAAVPYCYLFRCFCRWRLNCSDSIQRYAPGMDYRHTPDGADDRPRWSVLVGCTCADQHLHNLRLHRFRVTSWGRVIGHSNDLLEPFFTVHPEDKENTVYAEATAALAPGGRRLDVICTHYPPPHLMRPDELNMPPKAVAIDLVNKSTSQLEPLPFLKGLDRGGDGWDVVASHHSLERLERTYQSLFAGPRLRGYAVIDDKFILLSLVDGTFFCFNCATGSLTRVRTTDKASEYECISGRAVHVQEEGAIYFINGTTLFAYKYSPEEEEDAPLEPPAMVDMLWPYYDEGRGFVVQLAGQMLCAVWINMYEACSCGARHAMITTFRVGSAAGSDGEGSRPVRSIEVLHSTCRRVDMLREKSYQYNHYDTFATLQAYADDAYKVDDTSLPAMFGGFSHPVEDSQELLKCCRNYLKRKGELVWTADSLVDCKVVTKCDVSFICQVDQQSVLYRISTTGGKLRCDASVLEPQLCLDKIRDGGASVDFPATWHFVHDGSQLFVIPSFPDHSQYKIDLSSMSCSLVESRRRDIYFSAVFQAGGDIVAIGEKLMAVYTLDRQSLQWVHRRTSGDLDLEQEIKVSGFADVGDGTFLISDFDTERCFLCDLRHGGKWFVVEPPSMSRWLGEIGLLNGRCIFAEGFVYACWDEGLEAYELAQDDGEFILGAPIVLEFPWQKFSDRRFMSFECIGKEEDSISAGCIVFCVIQGYFTADPFTDSHSLTATTVIVEREDAPKGKKRPVRVKHVDVAVSSVRHEEPILTNYAFAL